MRKTTIGTTCGLQKSGILRLGAKRPSIEINLRRPLMPPDAVLHLNVALAEELLLGHNYEHT